MKNATTLFVVALLEAIGRAQTTDRIVSPVLVFKEAGRTALSTVEGSLSSRFSENIFNAIESRVFGPTNFDATSFVCKDRCVTATAMENRLSGDCYG